MIAMIKNTLIGVDGFSDEKKYVIHNNEIFWHVLNPGNNFLYVGFTEAGTEFRPDLRIYYKKRFSLIASYYEHYYRTSMKNLMHSIYWDYFHTIKVSGTGNYPDLFPETQDAKLKSYGMKYTGKKKNAEKIITQFIEDHENIVMPRIKELTNIHNLNEYLNDPWDKFLWTGQWPIILNVFYDKMIISTLAGDGNLDLIFNKIEPVLKKKAFREGMDKHSEYKKDHYALLVKMYERLCDTPPLEDPNLDNYDITESIIYEGL